jgi:hypothetical protein
MAGLVPAIHVFILKLQARRKTWMPATSAGMTARWLIQFEQKTV